MLTSSGDCALLESDRLRSNHVHAGLPPDKGDNDSVPSLSSHDTPLHNDDAVHDNDRMEDELPDVAHGVHTDSFENCFSVRMSASDYSYRAPGTITTSDWITLWINTLELYCYHVRSYGDTASFPIIVVGSHSIE
jgi:hypothetical protein